MSPVDAAGSLPAAESGSIRYFVLLYCPGERRLALATLLAIADEIDAARAQGIEHAVAHVRLEWWRQEAQRFARGAPEHPWLAGWLRAHPADRALELAMLPQAAALDLAAARLSGQRTRHLAGALYALAARLLGLPPLSTELDERLRALGAHTAELEDYAAAPEQPSGAPDAAPPIRPMTPPLPLGAQPPLAALLVWNALAEQAAQRRGKRRGAQARQDGRFDPLIDNLVAWRTARRALRGSRGRP